MNPFQATSRIEYEAALESDRAGAVTKKAAILVNILHDVLRRDSEQRYRRLVLCKIQKANVGLIGAVAGYAVIGDPAAEFARQLLDPAVGEGNTVSPHERRAIGRGAWALGFQKIWIVLGAGPIARWCYGLTR